MGKPKQVNKLSQKFESAAYEGVSRAQTGNARLLHVNEVISWIRDLADSTTYADEDAAKAAGLKKGDLYIQTGSGAINIVLTT
tara:strand:+ start:111 stop:359 length:249 start_codon:yes stop_codon:yes gene_type:complete